MLPEQYVGYFTVENVLGSTDSWLATELTAELPAPGSPVIKPGVLTWESVNGAAGYMIYADGKLIDYTTSTSYTLSNAREAMPDYTVRAINANGAQGHLSDVAVDTTTGIDSVGADINEGEIQYFNLQGIRVANPSNGIYIRRQGDTVEKVYIK